MIKDPKPNLSQGTMLINLKYRENVIRKLKDELALEAEEWEKIWRDYQKSSDGN